MWIGCFKKFLEMVFRRLSLPLEVTFSSRYELLAGVVGFLIVIAVAGLYGNVAGSVLLPLLAALSAFPGTFDSGLGGHGPAMFGGRSRIT
jgi:hypothetical protein